MDYNNFQSKLKPTSTTTTNKGKTQPENLENLTTKMKFDFWKIQNFTKKHKLIESFSKNNEFHYDY